MGEREPLSFVLNHSRLRAIRERRANASAGPGNNTGKTARDNSSSVPRFYSEAPRQWTVDSAIPAT